MGRTSSAVKNRYNEKAYDRVTSFLPKGRKADVEAFAKSNGESVNGLINRLLQEAMQLNPEQWKKPPETAAE